jgi:hypothetical protein
MSARKILIMGLPQSGKTTLAKTLVPLLGAVHFNADAVRGNVNKDLGFSHPDRIEQSRRMGWLCDRVVEAGHYAVADFVCPTPETRAAFGDAYVVYVNTRKPTPYEDTRSIFVAPEKVDFEVLEWDDGQCARLIARHVITPTKGFDWRKPAAIFIGRYQPFHDGHKALVMEGLRRVGQVCIAVRDTEGIDSSNPFSFESVRSRIASAMFEHMDHVEIIKIPNISHVFYGRSVGYQIERIELTEELESISATEIRHSLYR